jgi:tetratricopeptide (TPR) repeat protein
LKKVGSVTADEDDVALLQLYIDLESEDEPFAQRMVLLDRLLVVSKERSDQLQYRGAKAVQYFLIKDKVTAEREVAKAIDGVKATIEDDPLSDYERLIMGRLLQLLASFRNDAALFKEAIGIYNELLLEDNWTKTGRARLHHEIGDSYKLAGDWAAAEAAYRYALTLEENQLDHIHLADCLLHLKRLDEAVAEIEKIDRSKLERHEFEDYIFVLSAIAIWSEKGPLLQESKELLTAATITEPYFNERRLALLLSVGETLARGSASAKAKANSTPPGGVASAASSFILLQPNIMGIGINFNAIIDYVLRRKTKE